MPLAYIPKICVNQESGGNSVMFPEIIAARSLSTHTHTCSVNDIFHIRKLSALLNGWEQCLCVLYILRKIEDKHLSTPNVFTVERFYKKH